METVGMVVALITVGIALYALYWARKEDVVQPEEGAQHLRVDQGGVVAGGEAAEAITEIGPAAAGTEGGTTPLNLEEPPERVS